jgi:hypothetical protein
MLNPTINTTTNYYVCVRHVTAFYLQFNLYQPDDGLFNLKYVAIWSGNKCVLCFDWRSIIFHLIDFRCPSSVFRLYTVSCMITTLSEEPAVSILFAAHLWYKIESYLGRPLNPLNAELNPICHLLVLLGDLTFMDPCIVSIFQHISNKTTLHTLFLSGNCSTCFECYLHTAAGSSNGVTNTRCCRYCCMRSWWWVKVKLETCRAVSR